MTNTLILDMAAAEKAVIAMNLEETENAIAEGGRNLPFEVVAQAEKNPRKHPDDGPNVAYVRMLFRHRARLRYGIIYEGDGTISHRV